MTTEIEELRLSVSKSKTFSQCRKLFNYSYILKLPKKERDYHVLGKFCHKVLEDFHLAYINNSTNPYHIEMGIAYKSALAEYQNNMTADMKKECWGMIDKYLRIISNDKKKGKVANVISVEKNFKVSIGNNVVLNGMIDRIQKDDDGVLHIADYKTSKSTTYLKKDWFQLLTYAFVMLDEDPSIKKIRGSYIMLRHNYEYLTKEFSVNEILKVKDQFLKYADEIRDETEYPATPQILCRWCDFVDICPEGSKMLKPKDDVFGEVGY